ncbi:MAG: hypothetical protein L6R35_006665, partial [Caloplaca aegaea]
PLAELFAPHRSSLVDTKFLWHTITSIGQSRSISLFSDLLDWRQVASHAKHNRLAFRQTSERVMFAPEVCSLEIDSLPLESGMG